MDIIPVVHFKDQKLSSHKDGRVLSFDELQNVVKPDETLYVLDMDGIRKDRPNLCSYPPWILRTNLERTGLLDQRVEPKEDVEDWLNGVHSIEPDEAIHDFIDVSVEEYLDEPQTHFRRLWDHFLE